MSRWVLFSLFALCCFLLWNWIDSDSIPYEPLSEQSESVNDSIYGADRSSEWPAVRAAFVKRHPRCEACGTQIELNVHHIIPFHTNPKLELDTQNLITLCREHHFKVGHDPDGPWLPRKPNWYFSNPRVREDAAAVRKGRKIR